MFSKEEIMIHLVVQRGQIRKDIPPIPIKVRITSRTRHPGLKVILPMGGISQDMKKQDNKLVLRNEKNMV